MRGLLIAEKPSLMREIMTAYNTLATKPFELNFMSFRGHFMELDEPDKYLADWGKPWRASVLPMIPDPFKMRVKTDCVGMAEKIKDELKNGKYDFVVNACDTGREGEAIFWTFYNSFGFKIPVKRIWHQDITISKLQEGLLNLRDYSKDKELCDLRDASLLRMKFDWLVGMNLSRAGTLAVNKLMAIGRVQTPTLNIVVTRDNEIDNFVPKDFFEVEGDFGKYKGLWFNANKSVNNFDKETDAKALVSRLSKNGKIIDVKEETVSESVAPLYSLPELQKEANRVLGFPANKTLEIAQKLYETHKILSYPRTDSRALSTSMALEVPKHLAVLTAVDEIEPFVTAILADPARIKRTLSNKKYVDNSKVTDHHALINTELTPNMLALTKDEKDLFLLVVRRFVSIFMDPYVINRTTIITEVDGETFKTVGSIVVSLGYRSIYASKKNDDENLIPAVKMGETVVANQYRVIGKKTNPPKPYTDGTLIDAMMYAGRFASAENKDILKKAEGIGTSATRADIIEKLISKSFIERKGKALRSTQVGKEIITTLHGKSIISPDLTAEWEGNLNQVEDGKISVLQFEDKMKIFTQTQTEEFLKLDGKAISSMPKGDTVGKCPACGSDVVMNKGGVFCTKYKNPCTYVAWRIQPGVVLSDTQLKKLVKNGRTDELNFKSKTSGKEFKTAIAFDKTDNSVKFAYALPAVSIGKCPKCAGAVLDKGNYCKCDKCNFSLQKVIKDTKLTNSDIKNLIVGKETSIKEFETNGKKWTARLKYKPDFSAFDFLFEKKS